MSSDSVDLERETVYSLLADRVREQLLGYLTVVGRTTISDAAERIAEWQRETIATSLEDRQQTVTIELIHNHLPRLSQHDVVEYDRSSEAILPGSNFEAVEPYVSDLDIPVGPQ